MSYQLSASGTPQEVTQSINQQAQANQRNGTVGTELQLMNDAAQLVSNAITPLPNTTSVTVMVNGSCVTTNGVQSQQSFSMTVSTN